MCCTVRKCCFCVNLSAGVITIACFCLVGDALLLAWTSYVTHLALMGLQDLLADGYVYEDVRDLIPIGALCILLAFDVVHSVSVVLHIMLLVGAITGRARLLFGWVAAYAVMYAFFLVASLLDLVLTSFYNTFYGLIVFAGVLVHAGLTMYFWMVVRSYYLELDGGGGSRSTAGKVYHTVPPGGVFPAHDTYGDDEGGFVMQATAPPLYPGYTQEPPRPYLCVATAHGVTR